MPASIVPLVCLWGQGMPSTPSELFQGSQGYPSTSMSCSRGHGTLHYSHIFSSRARAMGIPYSGIILVGTTHDTSLLYALTRCRRA